MAVCLGHRHLYTFHTTLCSVGSPIAARTCPPLADALRGICWPFVSDIGICMLSSRRGLATRTTSSQVGLGLVGAEYSPKYLCPGVVRSLRASDFDGVYYVALLSDDAMSAWSFCCSAARSLSSTHVCLLLVIAVSLVRVREDQVICQSAPVCTWGEGEATVCLFACAAGHTHVYAGDVMCYMCYGHCMYAFSCCRFAYGMAISALFPLCVLTRLARFPCVVVRISICTCPLSCIVV